MKKSKTNSEKVTAPATETKKVIKSKADKTADLKAKIESLPENKKAAVKDAESKSSKLAATTVMREIKYKYPKEIILDQEAKKKFRQKVRNKVRAMEREIAEMKGQTRKDAEAELAKYKSTVLV